MKKIFTLMLMLAFALFAGVSCTNDQTGDEKPDPTAPVVTVTGVPELNLAPEAGSFTLNYAIENATLTGVLNISTEAAWLTKGEDTGAAVTFNYAANSDAPGSAAREAVIVFAYEGAESVSVTVKQDSQAPSFEIEWANVTCGYAQYTCTPADGEMLYLLASTQELGQFGIQGETPQELMQNYAQLLASYGMLTGEADGWYVFKGATTEMPKEASRFSAEDTVTVFALGLSVTVGEVDPETGMPAITVNHLTPVHAWDVPFLPYPTLTVPEEQLVNNVSAAAGELVLDCVLENALNDGSEVTLNTEATWVHPTWADNKLTIAYDANDIAVARRAKIAVQYGWWTNPFEVTVTQEKNAEATAITLKLTVKGTQFNGILVDVEPSDPEVYYALNHTTPEKDWETEAELPIDWMQKAEDLVSYTGNASFHKGNLTDYLVKTNVQNYEYNGLEYYVYAVAVDATSEEKTDYFGKLYTEWTVNKILSEVVVSEKTTVDVSKMPAVTWDLEKSGLALNSKNYYAREVVEGSTVVLYFNVENPVEGASLKLNGTTLIDSYNVVDGEPVIDNVAGTITFKIDAFDPAKTSHYIRPNFKYTNETDDLWGIMTPSLQLTQVENPGMALPYQESFENGIGNFTINDVLLGEGLSYVWKHENGQYGYYMKASAFAGSAKESESWLVSPKIDLSAATMPGLQFSHTHKFAGTPAEDLTLWVKEYGAAEWTQVTIPTYGTDSDYDFVIAAVDLSAWAGKKVQIGFKYISSTSAAGTWEVKDVVVYDAGGAAAPFM
ncbi:MAG: hypothetical protein E7129_00410 [Rikenellaceae bacterium]|nr:hypothetical protein [Rikenellaceae bacterium]